MSNFAFALVSTVDTGGPEFPGHCVMLFETETEAYLYAMKCIAEHDETVKYVEDEALWEVGDEHFDSAIDALFAWQDGLGITEYFHVMPIRKIEKQ